MDKIGYAATIGTFDGVHRGHQFVLRRLVAEARDRGLLPLVVTFDASPRREQVLTPLDEKLRLIRQAGVDHVEVLSFTPELKAMTAREFMARELCDRLGVRLLLTGYDNRFGRNRETGFDDYVRYGRELGVEVLGLPAEGAVSSSLIRQQLLAGAVDEAAEGLGRCYTISGHVAHGHHIGTGLGFPTANLIPDDPQQLIPAAGVYAVSVNGATPLQGMMNIGTRPTFDGHHTTLEVHILHHDEDLYGRPLSVSFVGRLREERRFDSAAALQQQLQLDALQTEQILSRYEESHHLSH